MELLKFMCTLNVILTDENVQQYRNCWILNIGNI